MGDLGITSLLMLSGNNFVWLTLSCWKSGGDPIACNQKNYDEERKFCSASLLMRSFHGY